MNLKKRYILCVMITIILFALGCAYAMGMLVTKEEDIYQVTYIYRSSLLDESQQSIKQGISKAASDYKFEIKEVTFDTYITVEEQIALIEKEVETGADAILIEPLDDERVYDTLLEVDKSIPVILVNGNIDVEGKYSTLTCVNTDYYNMGKDLAEYIIRIDDIQRVYLLQEDTQFADKNEMFAGVYDTLIASDKSTFVLELDEDYTIEMALREFALGKYRTHAFVVFKGDNLEIIGDQKEDTNAFSRTYVFGFEKSNDIINYIETDVIDAIGVPNEYSIGYQSATLAINELNGITQENLAVEYEIIDRYNIYTQENQRLLFPFVQ